MFFLVDYCTDLGDVLYIAFRIVNLIKWVVPVLLIIFGTLDLAKAVIAGKEDEMKAAQKIFFRRVVYAVAVFLVATLVTFVWKLLPANATDGISWDDCWEQQKAKD